MATSGTAGRDCFTWAEAGWKRGMVHSGVASPAHLAGERGMVFVPGGTFWMGSDRHYPEEAPAHKVAVDGFLIDRHPVTNRQFREFVKATDHVTCAEIPPDPGDYPGALPHMLFAGSLVFKPPARAPADLSNWSQWWTFLRGADWRHPYGPKKLDHGLGRRPRRPRGVSRRARLRALGRQGPAHRGRVGIRRARWARRRRVRVGRRVRARGQASGEHLAGRVPASRTSPRTATGARRR